MATPNSDARAFGTRSAARPYRTETIALAVATLR